MSDMPMSHRDDEDEPCAACEMMLERKVALKSSNRRRQVQYYMATGWLAYQDDKMDCSSVAQLAEVVGKDPRRTIRKMVKEGTIEECPTHPGRYRVTAAMAKAWGLPDVR